MYSESLGKRQWNSTWDGLPGEIRLLIFEALLQNGSKLSRFATVSREWQAEIERHNFAQIKVTPSRLADFDSMTRRNRALVGCIWFCVELDRYDCSTCAPDFVYLTLEEYSEAISTCNTDGGPVHEAFRDLFVVLGTWEPRGDLKLDISIYSPSDSEHWFPYLSFMPDTPSYTPGSGEMEQTMFNKTFHDPQHGWVAGYRHSAPRRAAIRKIFYSVMDEGLFQIDPLEYKWWDKLPLVPAVTSLLLRQQNRRRWDPLSLAHMFARFPRLQEIHYEPWREWDQIQECTDRGVYCLNLFELVLALIRVRAALLMTRILNLGYELFFSSIQCFNNTLKRLTIFENFNQQYPVVMNRFLYGVGLSDCDNIRNPVPAVGRMVALTSLELEHLAASFIVDASHFFEVAADWKWPNLTSLVLTSQRLTPNAKPTEIGAMLQAAAAAAIKMPQLETMEIWNGRKGLAALFKYQASRKYRQATITWRGTWRLTGMHMNASVVQAWEAVVRQYDGWRLTFDQERLDGALINSHADAIHYLGFSSQVIRPISLQQIRMEQKALKGVETVE